MPVIRSWSRTDVGRKRKHNEDSCFADDAMGLYVVADGMGGHAAGELASAQAVKSIREALAEGKPVLESFSHAPTVEAREHVAQLMEKAILRACADIHALPVGDRAHPPIAPTPLPPPLHANHPTVGPHLP